MRPIIGITCNYRDSHIPGAADATGVVGQNFHAIAEDYIHAIERAGGCPVVLPLSSSDEVIEGYLELCDGILIAGGNDVNPACYGEELMRCGTLVPKRDTFDLRLVQLALERTSKPILGICRGCQILNVALGGTLHQDLQSVGYRDHRLTAMPRNLPSHTVRVQKDSRLFDIVETEQLGVNSYHHQAIHALAEGAVCSAHASADGVPESIEIPGERFFLGVQWHPEMMYDQAVQQKIFAAFVDAAKTCVDNKG